MTAPLTREQMIDRGMSEVRISAVPCEGCGFNLAFAGVDYGMCDDCGDSVCEECAGEYEADEKSRFRCKTCFSDEMTYKAMEASKVEPDLLPYWEGPQQSGGETSLPSGFVETSPASQRPTRPTPSPMAYARFLERVILVTWVSLMALFVFWYRG